MKKIIYSLFLFSFTLLMSACEEEPPYINYAPEATIGDTTFILLPAPTPQPKNVLIEEVTGVRCPNCPKAQVEAKTISENNPGRINIVTIHPLNKLNALTRPFSQAVGDKHTSLFDFRTEPGAQIFEMVGLSGSLPIGNVNRKLFASETSRNIDYQKWSAYVSTEIIQPTPVNINISAKNLSDSIEIEVTLTYTEVVADSNFLTLMILESDMEDVQESKDVNGSVIYVENYIHNHVLRGVVTGYYGDLLKASYEPGRVFYKKYRIKRDSKWNAKNLDALAIVHLNTTKKNVIHSKDAKVQ
ncbi:MAG: Omp28-related outer membrane protein [bacterium]|nr:Omp28-related outer membrane protein [bacterium]